LKLQTTEDCLIKDILKIEFDDNRIFITDANSKMFVFDDNGSYLNTIGSIGRGPNELLSMYDTYIDKIENTVNIYDTYKASIFKYSYSGKLLKVKKLDSDLLTNTSKITLLEDNNLLLIQENHSMSLFNYRILNTKNNKKQDHLPYMATGNLRMAFGESKTIKIDGTTYMNAFLSDTIYQYNRESRNIVPSWIFKGKLKPATKKDFYGDDYEIGLGAYATAKRKNLSTGIKDIYSTDKYIHFIFETDTGAYRTFYNMETQLGYYHKIAPADPYISFNNLIATTEQAFVCIIRYPGEVLYDNYSVKHSDLKYILDNSREDDNPILVFYYFD
jgi:hypothetical protein